MQKKTFKQIALLSLALAAIAIGGKANAQSDSSVVIQPAKISVTAQPGQKVAKYFSIINRSNFRVNMQLIVKDFKQSSQDGKILFYDSKKEPASSWLVPQYVEISLSPLETKQIGIVVNVPEGFSGGGHYGAILFQPIGSSADIIKASNFGELVQLTVAGSNPKASATGNVVSFQTPTFQQGSPVYFNFTMQNKGNAHFEANGRLIISNWLGKELGKFDAGNMTIYPQTYRTFKWKWNSAPKFGLLKATMSIAPNGANPRQVGQQWFIILPWQYLAAAAAGLAIIFALIRMRKKIALLASPLKIRINMDKS